MPRLPGRPPAWLPHSLAALFLLLMLAAAGWWSLSPQWTLARLQANALAGDRAALAAGIDFPALRQSVERELIEEIDAADRRPVGPMAAWGLALARAHVPQLVETMVTEETLGLIVASAGELAPSAALQPLALLTAPDVRIERNGLDSFTVRLATADPDAPALRFQRHGLAWLLSGIDLRAPSAPAAAVQPPL